MATYDEIALWAAQGSGATPDQQLAVAMYGQANGWYLTPAQQALLPQRVNEQQQAIASAEQAAMATLKQNNPMAANAAQSAGQGISPGEAAVRIAQIESDKAAALAAKDAAYANYNAVVNSGQYTWRDEQYINAQQRYNQAESAYQQTMRDSIVLMNQISGAVPTSSGGGGVATGKSATFGDMPSPYQGGAPGASGGLSTAYIKSVTDPETGRFLPSTPGSNALNTQKVVDIVNATIPFRQDYAQPSTLGDLQTQRIAAQAQLGLSIFGIGMGGQNFSLNNPLSQSTLYGSILSQQMRSSQGREEYKPTQFYGGELQKVAENMVALGSQYHFVGKMANQPIPANPFEYQSDLAVEFLKGGPTKPSEVFSPVSGQMVPFLPGGQGLQQYQWNMAVAYDKGNPVSYESNFIPAFNRLSAAQGDYGPYGTLFGGPGYNGTASSNGIQVQTSTPFSDAFVANLKAGVLNEYGMRGIPSPSAVNQQPILNYGSFTPIIMAATPGSSGSENSILSGLPSPYRSSSHTNNGIESIIIGKMNTVTPQEGIIGIFARAENRAKMPEGYIMSPANNGGIPDAIGFGMLAAGTAMSMNTENFFSTLQSNIPGGIIGSPVKAGLGFIEVVPQTAAMVPLVGGAAYLFGKDVKWGTSQIIPTATNIATATIERGITQPERSFGNLVGMVASGEMASSALGYTKMISPVGFDIAEIGSSTGARSALAFAYTKPIGAGVEASTIRAYAGLTAMSEPAKILGSKAFSMNPSEINFIGGRVPTFQSVEAARASLGAEAGTTGTFLHGIKAGNVPFIQDIIERGEFIVGAGARENKPLYLSSVQDSVYSRFAQEGIIRVTGKVEPIESALKFGGSVDTPILSEGIFPGVKPITGTTYKGMLQQELIVPAGTRLSVTDISFIEKAGTKIPVIDMTIGKVGVVDRIAMASNRFEYGINSLRVPEVGFGQPTSFLKKSDIAIGNPLEEVAARQWTPAQKAVLNPYLEAMAKQPGAGVGLKAVVAGQKAVPLFREVNFVQREPVGQILVGRELNEATIGKVFANRAKYGDELVSGGSTTIRANLGDAFFDSSIIGDIDAWTKASRVAELQTQEIKIVAADQPKVLASRAPGIQEGFPVAKVEIGAGGKTLTEMHAFEAFPAVTKAENIGTLKAVGGADVTGPTTGFFGGIRKSSAAFDKQMLRQLPGELPEIRMNLGNNPKNPYGDIKHAVGTTAVAKEAASLLYGRDAEITGMTPSYAKGRVMENYANAMSDLLKSQKGEAANIVERYQKTIKVNPLELPETKAAKARAYAKVAPADQILGVGLGTGKRVASDYPVIRDPVIESKSFYPVSGIAVGSITSSKAMASVLSISEYPERTSSIVDVQYPTPVRGISVLGEAYPTPITSIRTSEYPMGITTPRPSTRIPEPTYPISGIPGYPIVPVPIIPITGYPTTTTTPTSGYPPFTPPFTPPPTPTTNIIRTRKGNPPPIDVPYVPINRGKDVPSEIVTLFRNDKNSSGGQKPPRRRKRQVELFSFEYAEDTPVPKRYGLGGKTLLYVPGSRGAAKGILPQGDIAPNRLFDVVGGTVADYLASGKQKRSKHKK